MTGFDTGPSVVSLTERAAEELTNQGHPMLAQAVRQAGAYNQQLLEHIDTLTGLLDQATQAGETYAGMYRLAVENTGHYRDLLQRIAKSASLEDAISIAHKTVTGGCCVRCLLGQSHTEHDASLAAVQRASVTAPVRRTPDPLIPGYLTEAVPYPPAI